MREVLEMVSSVVTAIVLTIICMAAVAILVEAWQKWRGRH